MVNEFFLQLLSAHFIDVFIHTGYRLELRNELQCRLFADTGHTGNIVSCIPHEGLHVDNLSRRIAVLRLHDVRRYGEHVGNPLFGQVHRHVVIDELQCIAVAGYDIDGKVLLFQFPRQRTDNVIAFITFQLENADAQTL